jgi:hypothetical protein
LEALKKKEESGELIGIWAGKGENTCLKRIFKSKREREV